MRIGKARYGPVCLGGLQVSVCAIRNGNSECSGADWKVRKPCRAACIEDSRAICGGSPTGLWRWKPGPPTLYPAKDGPGRLAEGAGGDILIATPPR